MNVDFRESAPRAVTKEDIVVSGTQMGWVETAEKEGHFRYHVGFNLAGSIGGIGLIQGHGSTKEEAILNSISDARRSAAQLMASVDALEISLGISTGTGN